MNNLEDNERRSSIRIEVELRVYYGPHQSKLLTGYSVDLGAGGLFLSTTCPFDIDDIVKLKFTVPGEEKNIACSARVAWINQDGNQRKPEYPEGAGLEFADIAPEDIDSIKSYLNIKAVW
jgi:uncharacterized protein (TIGR02266 family)